ncbi:hypothetical protein B0J17DRAFT_721644 [Rhizoctonia solani]|nr:hypothetical protein B0J17DRAFT_721644 [Rhizoctonia solani]
MEFMLWLFAFDDMADLGELKLGGLKRAVDTTMNVLYKPDDVQPELKIAATLHRYYNLSATPNSLASNHTLLKTSFFDRMRQNGSAQAIRHFVEATES